MNRLSRTACRFGLGRWWPGARLLRRDHAGLAARASSLTDAALYLAGTEPLPAWDAEPAPHVIDLSADAPNGPPITASPRPNAARELRARIPGDGVLLTHGLAGAFAAFLDAWVRPGSVVVLPVPCPPIFLEGLRSRRARVRFVPSWAEGGELCWDARQMARSLRGADWLVLAAPSNPFGAIVGPERREELAAALKGRSTRVFLDATFSDEQFHDGRIVTATSLGRELGRAGLKVGSLAGSAVNVGPIRLILEANHAQPSPLTLAAALGLWDRHDFALARSEAAERAAWACEALADLGPTVPGGGRHLWLSTVYTGMTGGRFAHELLRAEEVLVRPGDAFGPGGLDGVRIGLHGDAGRLREGLRRVARFTRDLLGHHEEAEPMREPEEFGVPSFERSTIGGVR